MKKRNRPRKAWKKPDLKVAIFSKKGLIVGSDGIPATPGGGDDGWSTGGGPSDSMQMGT